VTGDELLGGPRRANAHVDPMRAGIVVVCFLVALALLLGPASNVVGGSASRSTTTTTQPPPVDPSKVRVQVANGTATPHLAGQWSTPLNTLNWDVLPPEDAAHHSADTLIYYAAGYRHAAEELAIQLSVPRHEVVALVPHSKGIGVAGSRTDDVVIIIGVHHHGEGVKAI
jgi:hypothetical protein